MQRFLLTVMAASALSLAHNSTASAQGHDKDPLVSCIKEFYDPGMYNYLTFQNTCAQSLTVVLIPKDGSPGGGTLELRPGAKDSVGLSNTQKKVPKPGSFRLYVCPSGYVPLDDSGQPVSKPTGSFRCEQKTK